MARPDWADFTGRVVAYRDDEIHLWRVRPCEFVPVLGAQVFQRVAGFHHLLDSEWIHLAARRAAGAVTPESPFAHGGDQGFSHDAASGISGAKEQDVVSFVGHGNLSSLAAG